MIFWLPRYMQGFDVVFYGEGLVEMLRGTTMGG